MKLVVLLTDATHDAALRQAREVGRKGPLEPGVLHAPLDDELQLWTDRVWDTVEGAVKKAYRESMEAARPLIDKASALLAEIGSKIGQQAEKVRSLIIDRLNVYLQAAIDGALQLIRPTILVGGRELTMTSVKIEQS